MNNQCQLMNQSSVLNPFGAKMMTPHRNWAPQPLNMPPMNNLNFPNQQHKYGGRGNWKGNNRRKDAVFPQIKELEHRNRLKAKRFYDKKKLIRANAPRNTTSYLIRAKKEGGIATLVSPCPTPAVLTTPVFSPSREALGDMAKEEWGVDGYGSMKGLIRLRSDDYEDGDEGDSNSSEGESDVEEHLEVERRLDQDLSRFEMVYPSVGSEYSSGLENRVDDQDSHLSQLEGENVALKERLYLMERELGEIKRRMQCLERRRSEAVDEVQEELVETVSENDESEGTMDEEVLEDGSGDERKDVELANENDGLDMKVKKKNGIQDEDLIRNDNIGGAEAAEDVSMEDTVPITQLGSNVVKGSARLTGWFHVADKLNC